MFVEHVSDLALLRSLPADALDWSMLCPANMTAESSTLSVSGKTAGSKLVGGADTLPLWRESWLSRIPLVGVLLTCLVNFSRYETTLEQNAELIAEDLEAGGSAWAGHAVGVVDASK